MTAVGIEDLHAVVPAIRDSDQRRPRRRHFTRGVGPDQSDIGGNLELTRPAAPPAERPARRAAFIEQLNAVVPGIADIEARLAGVAVAPGDDAARIPELARPGSGPSQDPSNPAGILDDDPVTEFVAEEAATGRADGGTEDWSGAAEVVNDAAGRARRVFNAWFEKSERGHVGSC